MGLEWKGLYNFWNAETEARPEDAWELKDGQMCTD